MDRMKSLTFEDIPSDEVQIIEETFGGWHGMKLPRKSIVKCAWCNRQGELMWCLKKAHGMLEQTDDG